MGIFSRKKYSKDSLSNTAGDTPSTEVSDDLQKTNQQKVDVRRLSFGQFADLMQSIVDGEGDISSVAKEGNRIFAQHEELADHEEDGWDLESLWFDVVEEGIADLLDRPGSISNRDLLEAIVLLSEHDSHLLCLLLVQDADRNQITPGILKQISNAEPCGHDNGRSDSCIGWPIRLALHGNTPVDVLSNLNDFKDHSDGESVRWALAMNPSTPTRILQGFTNSDSYGWRIQGEIEEFGISGVSIDEVGYEIQSFLRWAVAGNPSLPVKEKEVLANITTFDVTCPESVDVELLSSEIRKRATLQEQGTTQDLDVDNSLEIMMSNYYAMNPGLDPTTPLDELRTLAESFDETIQCNVAQNPSAPMEVLWSLAKSSGITVRSAVASNSVTPQNVLLDLATDSVVKVRIALAGNDKVNLEVLKRLASDVDSEVRSTLARNPAINSELLEVLAKDKDGLVRRNVAKNTSATAEVLALMIKDNDVWVRRNIASNPHAIDEILISMQVDEDEDVRNRINSRFEADFEEEFEDEFEDD